MKYLITFKSGRTALVSKGIYINTGEDVAKIEPKFIDKEEKKIYDRENIDDKTP